MQALAERTGGTYTPSAGTVYPRLAKLEEEGLVTKSAEGRKTVYAITPAGRAELDGRADELDGIEAGLSDSVRMIAEEVRGSVREAMRSLRAELAAAARDGRTGAGASRGAGAASGSGSGSASAADPAPAPDPRIPGATAQHPRTPPGPPGIPAPAAAPSCIAPTPW
ncbi:PadR family transcriptional regulator [Leucobacter massiliensis]|uniref:PadR family transcriptional regulator n=1 Tax=Leucobacter massiliensis TaxID=1686285 RepID=UPI002683D120